MRPAPSKRQDGFTLAEVMVAAAVLVIAINGAAAAILAATVAAARSRDQSAALRLAVERMEQLRSLSWGLGAGAAPVPSTDTTTDLSTTPLSSSGAGLSISSAAALGASTAGLVDYLDSRGRWVGNGASVAPNARFVRRWRVSRLSGSIDALVLEVGVSRLGRDRSATAGVPHDVRLLTIKARKGL